MYLFSHAWCTFLGSPVAKVAKYLFNRKILQTSFLWNFQGLAYKKPLVAPASRKHLGLPQAATVPSRPPHSRQRTPPPPLTFSRPPCPQWRPQERCPWCCFYVVRVQPTSLPFFSMVWYRHIENFSPGAGATLLLGLLGDSTSSKSAIAMPGDCTDTRISLQFRHRDKWPIWIDPWNIIIWRFTRQALRALEYPRLQLAPLVLFPIEPWIFQS